jgi:chemotaxis signal transduction protein
VLLVRVAAANVAIPIRRIAAVTRIPALHPFEPGPSEPGPFEPAATRPSVRDTRQLLGWFVYRGSAVLCADLAPEFTQAPHVYGASARLLLLDTGTAPPTDEAPLAVAVDAVGGIERLPAPRRHDAACSNGRFRCVRDVVEANGELVHFLNLPGLLGAMALKAVP